MKAMAREAGRDRGGNKVVDRQLVFHALANLTGRYIDSPGAGQAQNPARRSYLDHVGARDDVVQRAPLRVEERVEHRQEEQVH